MEEITQKTNVTTPSPSGEGRGGGLTKGIIACGLYIAFLVWIESWCGIIVLPFIFDAYVTKKIKWDWWKHLENGSARFIMSWVDAIVFALVAVYFVNIYFFQNYTIPSSSLEKSLLVGDYLFVSKTSYGPRVPETPLSMPLCQHSLPFTPMKDNSYSVWPQWKYKRVHPKRIALNDIVVFNYPGGDTVALGAQQQDYYLMCKLAYLQTNGFPAEPYKMNDLERYRFFHEAINTASQYFKQSKDMGEVIWRPVDRRENYVKRCVGLPGQTLQIKNHMVYLDGKLNPQGSHVQYNYTVKLKYPMSEEYAHSLGISDEDYQNLVNQSTGELKTEGTLPLTDAARKTLLANKDMVESVTYERDFESEVLYPLTAHTGWTRDNYGPIWIPEKGKSIKLTLKNLPIYERPIKVYEGNDLKVTDDGRIWINGKVATSYTFKMDYYWMQGDNRHNSADSRYWGFVPEDHIVGKPIFVWMSIDKDRGGLQHLRWNRMFRSVKELVK